MAIRSRQLSRTHREQLTRNGFIQKVIKGWYTSFWDFCASYLTYRFGDKWCVSPEQSLLIHSGDWTVPRQLLVRVSRTTNNVTKLPHDTSLLDLKGGLPDRRDRVLINGLQLFGLPAALIAASPGSYKNNTVEMRTALSMIGDASELLDRLLGGGHSTIAGRLAGAYRNIGRETIADDILQAMKAAGFDVRENDPFEASSPIICNKRETSPYVSRIRLMWQQMREPILERFPEPPGMPSDNASYLKKVEDIYTYRKNKRPFHPSPTALDRS